MESFVSNIKSSFFVKERGNNPSLNTTNVKNQLRRELGIDISNIRSNELSCCDHNESNNNNAIRSVNNEEERLTEKIMDTGDDVEFHSVYFIPLARYDDENDDVLHRGANSSSPRSSMKVLEKTLDVPYFWPLTQKV